MRKKIFKTPNHPSVSKTLDSIAQQYSNLEQYENAIKAYEDLLGKPIK
jgi:hypothetical protein